MYIRTLYIHVYIYTYVCYPNVIAHAYMYVSQYDIRMHENMYHSTWDNFGMSLL